jgi:PAS domain S-box-containing protein
MDAFGRTGEDGYAMALGAAGAELLQAILEAALDCIVVADEEGRVVEFNPAAERTFGWSRADILGRSLAETIVPPALRAAHTEGMQRFLATGDSRLLGERVEVEGMRRNGETFPVELTIVPVELASGRFFAAYLRDITGAREAKRALEESEANFRALVDDQTELVTRYDADFRMIFANRAQLASLGVTLEESIGQPVWRWIPPEIWPGIRAELEALTPERPLCYGLNRKPVPGGGERWFEFSNRALFDEHGNKTGYLAVGRDITERRRTERALAESEARLAAILEHAPVGVHLKDLDGRYIMANPKATEILKRPLEAIVGRSPADLFPPDEAAMIEAAVEQAIESGEVVVTEEFQPSLEPYEWTMVIRFPLEDEKGGIAGLGTFIVDITQQKRAQAELARQREALHQSEKLAALGSLLAGVAHELNNPLSIVVGRALMLEEDVRDAKTVGQVKALRTAAERCARIVKTFLSVARQKPRTRGPVEIEAQLDATLELLGYGLRTAGVEVARHYAAGRRGVVEADEDALHQVFLNLAVNAQQALQETSGPRRLDVATKLAGEWIEVSFADNGPGVPKAVRRRIFDPFFTTKPQGVGTGIGLSVCHGIIVSHGGTIGVDDRPGGGARFAIRLPLRAAGAVEAEASAAAARRKPAAGRILIVDDERDIAEMLGEIVEREGHVAVIAADGPDALARLDDEAFDLVITDLRMPDLDGRELLRHLSERPADERPLSILLTGDTLAIDGMAALDHPPTLVLEKPIEPHGLCAALGELLANRGRR